MDYNPFDVVAVPFPFTERDATIRRPALVLSTLAAFNRPSGHSVMAMITSAGNPPWPLDVPVKDLASAGLPAPSKVRMKLFTLDNRLVEKNLGRLSRLDRKRVERSLRALVTVQPGPKTPLHSAITNCRDERLRARPHGRANIAG